MLRVIDRLGFLQFDPLEVPGARNHDLDAPLARRWLPARVGRQWLYGPDRRLIELYNKSLNIVPLAELPYYRLTWDRNAADDDDGHPAARAGAVAEAILRRIRRGGPAVDGSLRRARPLGRLVVGADAGRPGGAWRRCSSPGRIGISPARGQPALLRPDRAARAGGLLECGSRRRRR